ncbi:MAG: hypothetical protein ACKO3N_17245, partial [Verrucomicrobiota bacterium]
VLLSVPLHGRGNHPQKGEGEGVRIRRYLPPAGGRGAWQDEVVQDQWHKTHNVNPVRWDADAADELLVAAREGAFLLNPGAGAGQPVKVEPIGGDENGGLGEIRAGRLARGGRFVAGISPMHGNQLVLFTPAGGPGPWKRRVLDDTLIDGHALACDLLGIGRDQIVVGWRAMGRPNVRVGIKLLTPLDEAGDAWRTTLVDDNGMACEDLALADLDADGRLDLVASGRATRNVKIYFNETPRR